MAKGRHGESLPQLLNRAYAENKLKNELTERMTSLIDSPASNELRDDIKTIIDKAFEINERAAHERAERLSMGGETIEDHIEDAFSDVFKAQPTTASWRSVSKSGLDMEIARKLEGTYFKLISSLRTLQGDTGFANAEQKKRLAILAEENLIKQLEILQTLTLNPDGPSE